MVEVKESSIQGTRVGSPDFLKRIQSIERIIGGTLDVLGTLDTTKRANIFGVDSGGTVHQFLVNNNGEMLVSRLGTLDVVKGGSLDVVKALNELKSGTIDVAKTVQTLDELKSGTLNVIQSLQELKSGTLDVLKSVQSIDELSSGTLDVLSRVDSIDELKSGTLNVIQSLQELKSGTLNSVEKVRRPLQKGTIVSAAVSAGGTIGPQAFTENELDKVTFGFNTNVGIAVNHELKIGDQWVTDGSDTIPTEGLVTTISHVFSDYRAVRKDPAGEATIATTYSGRN